MYFFRHAGEPNFSFRPPLFFREPARRVEDLVDLRRRREGPALALRPPKLMGGGAAVGGVGPEGVAIAPPGSTGELRSA
jgi:hypothetical protein